MGKIRKDVLCSCDEWMVGALNAIPMDAYLLLNILNDSHG